MMVKALKSPVGAATTRSGSRHGRASQAQRDPNHQHMRQTAIRHRLTADARGLPRQCAEGKNYETVNCFQFRDRSAGSCDVFALNFDSFGVAGSLR
jgi:hypothetical protein